MNIYVVKPKDTVWMIAKKFGTDYKSIITANGLPESGILANGQAIIIPSAAKEYTVRKGDSLFSIAKKFGVSGRSIADMNKLTNDRIYAGLVLKIPQKAKNYGYIETNGFIQPSNPAKERRILSPVIDYLTYITPFSHHVNADASLTPIDDTTIIQIANMGKAAPMLSVTNISGANFDTKLIDTILESNQLQQTLINNMLGLLNSRGYYGVIIDFEKISPVNRERYNNFLKKVVRALHPRYIVATALAPKTYDVKAGAWHGAHDYKAHGEIVDFVVIMTYEWGWSGGPPLAVAPLNEVRKVLNYAVSVIPRKKIMMGMALYGYDWTLPYTPGGEFAQAIGNQEAVERALKYGAQIKYDIKAQSPYYSYFDENKKEHIVWFEDARSTAAKYKLASELGLRGVSYWVLAKPFTQNFSVVDNMFNIEKLVK